MSWAASGLIAAAIAGAASPLVLAIVRHRVMDEPNERSSHSVPTPRAGGLAIMAGTAAGLLAFQPQNSLVRGVILTAFTLGALGLINDVREISVRARLGLQTVLSCAGLFWLLTRWGRSDLELVLVGAACVVWIVGFTNAFNFMDGINGISAAQLIVAGGSWLAAGLVEGLTTVTALGAITVGAAAGFLPWNFPRPRFFMGDVGSYFAGGWLAAAAILAARLGVPLAVVLAPLALYVVDTTLAVALKVRIGVGWHEPHRLHVYQRLVRAGWSHTRTTLFYSATSAGVAVASLSWLSSSALVIATGSLIAIGCLALYVFMPERVGGRALSTPAH